MRPRFFNRGNAKTWIGAARVIDCFNEAAVLQPRKRVGPDRLAPAGFSASMRPRFFNRGNLDASARRVTLPLLTLQ